MMALGDFRQAYRLEHVSLSEALFILVIEIETFYFRIFTKEQSHLLAVLIHSPPNSVNTTKTAKP